MLKQSFMSNKVKLIHKKTKRISYGNPASFHLISLTYDLADEDGVPITGAEITSGLKKNAAKPVDNEEAALKRAREEYELITGAKPDKRKAIETLNDEIKNYGSED